MAVSTMIQAIQSIFATPEYSARIPTYVQQAISNGNYGTQQFPNDIENAVYNTLVDKIAMQNIYSFQYNNFDASKYDKGYLPFGSIIEDDFVEAIKADEVAEMPTYDGQAEYEFTDFDPFKINYAKVNASYYALKTMLQYHVTTTYDMFKRAFISETGATDFVQSIRSVLPESGKLDKYLIFKNMIADKSIYGSTDVNCTVAGAQFTAEESINIVRTIRTYVEALKWVDTAYNSAGVLTSTNADNLVLFMTTGIHTALVSAQYNAFNRDLDFGCKVQLIDGFGSSALTSGQFACLLDESAIKLYKWLPNRFDNIWNPKGVGYWNTYYTFGDLMGYARHKNAIRFLLTNGQ